MGHKVDKISWDGLDPPVGGEFRTTGWKFEQDLTRNDRRKCESKIATFTGCSRLVLRHIPRQKYEFRKTSYSDCGIVHSELHPDESG